MLTLPLEISMYYARKLLFSPPVGNLGRSIQTGVFLVVAPYFWQHACAAGIMRQSCSFPCFISWIWVITVNKCPMSAKACFTSQAASLHSFLAALNTMWLLWPFPAAQLQPCFWLLVLLAKSCVSWMAPLGLPLVSPCLQNTRQKQQQLKVDPSRSEGRAAWMAYCEKEINIIQWFRIHSSKIFFRQPKMFVSHVEWKSTTGSKFYGTHNLHLFLARGWKIFHVSLLNWDKTWANIVEIEFGHTR